jgi:hypothetical protein
MHWCDRSGESFEAQLERARSLYREETNAAELADEAASPGNAVMDEDCVPGDAKLAG